MFAGVGLIAGLGALWLATTPSGLRALLGMAEAFGGGAFHAEGVSGPLRGPIAVARLHLDLAGAKIELAGVRLDWRLAALWSGRLEVARLRAESVAVFLKPSSGDAPRAALETLRTPLAFDLAALEVGRLAVYGAPPHAGGEEASPQFSLRDGMVSLRADNERFELRQLAAALPTGKLEATGELGAVKPCALRLAAKFAAQDYTLEGEGEGSLAEAVLHLRAQGRALRGVVKVTATPFAAVPLQGVDIDVDEFDPAAVFPGLPRAGLRLHAALAAAGDTDRPGLRGPVSVANARPSTLDAGGLPLKSLALRLDARLDEVRLDDIALDTGKGTLTGTLQWRAAREGEGGDQDNNAAAPAFALEAALHALDPRVIYAAAPRATINLHAAASGSFAARPTATVRAEFAESRLEGRPLAGGGRLTWDGAHVRDADVSFDFAGNLVKLAGAWGRAADRLTFEIDAPRLALAGFGLDGRLRAAGDLGGGLDAPAGTVHVEGERLRLPGNVSIVSLAGDIRLAAGESGALALALNGAGIVAGEARVTSVRLTADGQRDNQHIALAADGGFGGNAAGIDATAQGGIKAGRWRGRVLTLASRGRWPVRLVAPAVLEVGGAAVGDAKVGDAKVGDKFVLQGATFEVGEKGRLELAETRWSPGAAVLRGKLEGVALSMVPGLAQGRRDPLVLGAEWDLRLGESIEGRATVQREAGDVTVRGEIATRLGLSMLEGHLYAHNRRVTLALAARGSEVGEIGLSLEAGIERAGAGWRLAPHAPLTGAAHLDMPSLAWLGRLLRENADIDGALTADISAVGTPAAPDLRGNIAGHNLKIALVDQGLILAGGELEAGFTHHDGRQNLHLGRLAFESANRVKPNDKRVPYAELTATPGRLRVTGDVALGALEAGVTQRGQFAYTAERLPLLQRPDRWLIVSGQGEAVLEGKALEVDARLQADAGYIAIDDTPAPSLGDDVVVHRKQRLGETPEAATANASDAGDAGGALAMSGKIALELGQAFYLDAFGVDARLAGSMDVQLHAPQPPRALGAIRTVDGAWRGYGQRLAIERGTLTFQGDPANPGLNIVAMRRGMEIDAGVSITGDVEHPIVKLVSEPNVPDPEKLSWLVLGRAPDAAGADLGLLVPAAQALFGSTGGGMTDELARGLGFDSISVGQGDLNSSRRSATSKVVGGGSTISAGPATADDVVAVGKRLTNDLSLSFEQSLGGADSLVKLTYRLSRRLSFVARGGTDNALDVYYTFSFREGRREKTADAREGGDRAGRTNDVQ
ncbi:MAG: translocation/assembly module TamB domain-containing protein [Azoarcus sp.]|nr:translocation/assembly module TamB domain-containing protein [Azoarcus sp.]